MMTVPTWTHQQLAAIDARNNNILVSAAAGSGKTAVLVERIVQLIREGWQMDRMLIVTFTKAAASEMRQRLNRRLIMEAQGYPELFGKALDDLESTEISTIHAFCQKVLRNNFQAVGIDPMVRACDDQQKMTLFNEAWLAAFNELLSERDDADFLELAYAWDQAALQEMTYQLHDFLMSLPAPFAWLDEKVGEVGRRPYGEHPWYRMLVQLAGIELQGVGSILAGMAAMLDEPDAVDRRDTLEADTRQYEALRHVDMTDSEAMLAALAGYEFAKLKPIKGMSDEQKDWQKRFGKQRDSIKDIIKRTTELLTIREDQLDTEFGMMQRHLKGLTSLVKRTHALFLEKKAEQHVIDFSDMEHFALQVLGDEHLRNTMRMEYDHIFVDECQDVSQVQDAILQAIHHEGNILFMVGDVKQSIYRFRKADPTLFMHRLRTYSDDANAHDRRIILNKNFRSRANVLEATNQVFRTAMRPNVTELTYEAQDELVCGRETENDPPVEMHLLDVSGENEDGEAVEALEAEAAVVIQRVKELLETPFDDGKQVRNYTYRDMVILLSAASNTAPKLVELLGRAGIPVFYDGAAAFFELPEVQSVKALLSIIDNPLQDIPLLSALKMPPFALTDSQLASIRSAKTGRNVPFYEAFEATCALEGPLPEKCRAIRQQLADWRFEAETMRLSDFLWHVMQESGYYAAVGALPSGELRQANLRMLFQRAQDFEANIGGTLADFLLLCDKQSAADDKTSAKMLGENENLLRIMTMHKSKGLEFPVVFCMQMSGRLHKPFRGELLMHTRLGVALPYVNRELRIKRKTIANEAFRVQRELDDKAERARLLYVAMTRARERLILIGCCKGSERDVWHMPDSDYAVWNARSMTDWLMQGIVNRDIHNLSTSYPQDGNPWNVRVCDDIHGVDVDNAVDNISPVAYLQGVLAVPAGETCAAWGREEIRRDAPIKTSVSAITKKAALADPMPLTDSDEDAESKRVAEDIVAPLRMSDLPSRPSFLEEKQMTGAERGTLTHRALSILPLEGLTGDIHAAVKKAVHGMAEQEIFTYQEVLVLDLQGIAAYFTSELGQRMLASPRVRREWAFNLVMEDEGTLLQGVIDCAFLEDGAWVLVDYKTDRITDEEAFRQRYAMQLSWYARALERITGLPVKERWLYAIGKRRAYAV